MAEGVERVSQYRFIWAFGLLAPVLPAPVLPAVLSCAAGLAAAA